MSPEDIKNRFTFHPAATEDSAWVHSEIRTLSRNLADDLNDLLPEGREKALAITKLEEVVFWANAAVARQEGK